MTEEEHEAHHYRLAKHRFVVLIIGVIGISLILVVISMVLYAWSGAAQVDLSRPGYQEIRDQAGGDDEDDNSFSSEGPINEASLKEFETLYDEAAKALPSDSFSGTALSNEALRITTFE